MEPYFMTKISELTKQRARAFDEFKALAEKPTLTEAELADYEIKKRAVTELDAQIARAKDAQALSAGTAQPVAGQETPENKAPATVQTDNRQCSSLSVKLSTNIAAISKRTAIHEERGLELFMRHLMGRFLRQYMICRDKS
jgi:hypothetical protein